MSSQHIPTALQPGHPAHQPYSPEMNQDATAEKPPLQQQQHEQPALQPQYSQQLQPQQYPPPPPQQQFREPQGMPPLPPGWIAQWSQPHNSWFYIDTTTGTTQWELPAPVPSPNQTPPPNLSTSSPPPDPASATHTSAGPTTDQQHYTYKQSMPPQPGKPPGPEMQGGMPGPDGERGLGKVLMVGGAGLLAAASFGPLKNIFDKYFGNKPQPGQQGEYYQPQPQPQYGYGAPHPTTSSYGAGGGNYGQPTYGSVPPPMYANVNTLGVSGSRNIPPLYIHAAIYADKDVTHVVRTMVGHDQSIELKGDNLKNQFGDPWPAVDRKALIIIYQYGDRPWELLAMDNEDGISEIKPGPISKKRMEFCQPPPARILCAIWGVANATPAAHSQKLDTVGEMEASFDALGEGGFYSWQNRTLACFYRNKNGTISIVTCREGGTLRMPWNALAKW